jgi:hypothetical protein
MLYCEACSTQQHSRGKRKTHVVVLIPQPAPAEIVEVVEEVLAPDLSMWKECRDDAGKVYYWNREDNVTAWLPPEGWEGRAASDEEASGDENGDESEGDEGEEEDEMDSKGNELHAGWTATVDPTSGKEYYWNRRTKETRWDPGDAVRAPESQAAEHSPPAQTSNAEPPNIGPPEAPYVIYIGPEMPPEIGLSESDYSVGDSVEALYYVDGHW